MVYLSQPIDYMAPEIHTLSGSSIAKNWPTTVACFARRIS